MKKILLLLLACTIFCIGNTSAQSARTILDQTAQKLKSCGGISASFESTTYKGRNESGTCSGNISILGNKFKITSSQMTVWFDGTSQWTMFPGSGEVNLTTPTAEELQSINPYTFIDLYKQGYKSRLTYIKYQGRTCHELQLKKNTKAGISEMRIVVDPQSHLPYSIRLKQNNNWTRIRVNNIHTGKSWSNSHFRFSPSEHPQVEVIDLR